MFTWKTCHGQFPNLQYCHNIVTGHTFFMSNRKYGKKILKSIIYHRSCHVCQWWKNQRPGRPVRRHRCVRNHLGSARSIESASSVQGVREMAEQGTPVAVIEGDGDNTIMQRIREELNLHLTKKFDKNHVVKNIGKSLFELQKDRTMKLSRTIINHIMKCLKYALAKNQGDPAALEDNLRALIPHQFGDHTFCKPVFCGYKRKPTERYTHKSLPYKTSLKNPALRVKLDDVFLPIINKANILADLGSSQQVEHAHKEVMLRAPKHIHYGGSRALDYRVHATAAFVNEGRHYISKVFQS